jgi:hypothetical protein
MYLLIFSIAGSAGDKPGEIGEWAAENAMQIKPDKSKVVSYIEDRIKGSPNYSSWDQRIPDANTYKYLTIMVSSELRWAD